MSNNLFNIRAQQAGREWARENPKAIGFQVDDAATQYDPCDPGRRHFQMAAYDQLNRQNTEIYYRWNVGCRSGHVSGGMASTVKEAQECIQDVIQLYLDQGRDPNSYAIYNKDEECIVSMDRY
jgi:hypothetical protein